MTVEPLVPAPAALPRLLDGAASSTLDTADGARSAPAEALPFARALANAFGEASASLDRADRAEHAFAAGRGGLQEMVLERAQADVALSLASAAASRTSQALSTVLGMQV